MSDLLYSIFIPAPDGTIVKANPASSTGYASYANVPLGNSFVDQYRGQRAPSSTELIQQLVGTAYACADLNAGAVAANPFRLMARKDGGRSVRFWKTRPIGRRKALKLRTAGYDVTDGEVEEILPDGDNTHPLLKLLAAPTPDPNGIGNYDLRYCTQLYLESIGRAYWWLPGDRLGIPSAIWLLRSHMVREVPNYDQEGDLIAYYQYGRQQIPADEVVKFSIPDPYSLYYGGYSPLLAAIEKIRISRKEDAHVAALLDNMGRPDALLIPKGGSEGEGIGADEARRWRAMVQAEFRRAGRGGLMVSEFPGQMEVLGWKPQDIVEIERAKAIKTDICNCFGVPDALLERNAANLASAKTADYSHAKYAVNPRCVRMAETLNAKIVPLFDNSGRLFIVYDNPIPDDEVFELEVTRTGAQQGVSTVDENRAALGLDPIGGDVGAMRYMPSTMVPIGKDGMPIQPKQPEPAPTATDKPAPQKPKKSKTAREMRRAVAALCDAVKEITKEKVESVTAASVGNGEEKDLARTCTATEPEIKPGSIAPGAESPSLRSFDSIEAAREYLNTTHNGHGAIIDDTGKRLEGCRCGGGEVVRVCLAKRPDDNAAREVPAPIDVHSGADIGGDVRDNRTVDDTEAKATLPAGVEKSDGPDDKVPPREIGNRDHNTGLAGPLPQGQELLHILRRFFHEQEAAVLDSLATKDIGDEIQTKAGSSDLPDRIDPIGDDWSKRMAEAVAAIIEGYIVDGGRVLLQRIGTGIVFDRVVNPEVIKAAESLALKFCDATNATTSMQLDQALKKLREEFAEGLASGDGRVELRKRVQSVFEEADKSRAETIARTEASRATHLGENMAAEKSGVVKSKAWLASADCCDICEQLAEDSADGIPLDEPYMSTDYGPVLGPPAHPNCQCAQRMLLKSSEEIDAFAAGDENEPQTNGAA